MQYSIKVSSEPKFKFSDAPQEVVMEQTEESKSTPNSSDESSLVTEEDTSGNPLPPEIIQIRQRNKQLQKELTNSIMNYKSSSRSMLESSVVSEDNEETKEKKKGDNFSKDESPEVLSAVSHNEALKSLLDQIMKLQLDYENARKELHQNEEEIYHTETEYVTLKMCLKNVEEDINALRSSKSVNGGCGCNLI